MNLFYCPILISSVYRALERKTKWNRWILFVRYSRSGYILNATIGTVVTWKPVFNSLKIIIFIHIRCNCVSNWTKNVRQIRYHWYFPCRCIYSRVQSVRENVGQTFHRINNNASSAGEFTWFVKKLIVECASGRLRGAMKQTPRIIRCAIVNNKNHALQGNFRVVRIWLY